MKIIEQFKMSKTGRSKTCEDIIFTSDAFTAIIDGATARSNATYMGKSSGLAAAEIVSETLNTLPAGSSLNYVLEAITCSFRVYCKQNDIDINDYSKRLTASAVIFSLALNEIWMVGDCQAMIDGKLYHNSNGIDEHVAAVRALINQAELKKCKSLDWVAQNDPGAKYIQPLLNEQFLFQNSEVSCEGCFIYCAFDGFDIDPARVKVFPVSKGSEVVLASDGYPELHSTLIESEKTLALTLDADPLCIYENKCVKGVSPGNVSFDDRSYIRFTV